MTKTDTGLEITYDKNGNIKRLHSFWLDTYKDCQQPLKNETHGFKK